jgi:hypothetical protein
MAGWENLRAASAHPPFSLYPYGPQEPFNEVNFHGMPHLH